MTSEQRKIVITIYEYLLRTETRGWDNLDDSIEYLEYLTDVELYRDASVLFDLQKNKKVRCPEDHPTGQCLIPMLLESVQAILELYEETSDLHVKNKYILQYYLAMHQHGLILVDP